MEWKKILVFVLLSSVAYAKVLMVELYPNTLEKYEPDEYIVLYNDGDPENLGGWRIQTLTTTLYLPEIPLKSNDELVIAINGSYVDADLEVEDGSPAPQVAGKLRLSNRRECVTLINSDGRVVDSVAYGSSCMNWIGNPLSTPSEGVVLRRVGNVDTDTARDWVQIPQMPRARRVTDERITAIPFSSPENAQEAVVNFIRGAREELDVCVYSLDHKLVVDELISAARRGVNVRVMVEIDKGGLGKGELGSIRSLSDAGIPVRDGRNIHAKYAVRDGNSVLIMTENMNCNGLGRNRGWGIVVNSERIAEALHAIFDDDWKLGRKVTGHPYPPSSCEFSSSEPLQEMNVESAVLLVSPHHSLDPMLISTLRNSGKVYVEQFYAYVNWSDRQNPLIQALLDSSGTVRVLLDGKYKYLENVYAAEYLNRMGGRKGIDLIAKVLDPSEIDVDEVHTKGVIADDKVLVSSMNWNEHSALENREVGILISSGDVANYFLAKFEKDWKGKHTISLSPYIIVAIAAILLIAGFLLLTKPRNVSALVRSLGRYLRR